MSIPAFDLGLTLPPFLGARPGTLATQSPYPATTEEVVHRFGTTPARNELLRGLLNIRHQLRMIGIERGFQWIDGSFVEDKERRLGIAPGDIDIVTVFNRPAHVAGNAAWNAHIMPHLATIFHPGFCKANFHCEAFYIDADRDGLATATASAFWFSLFSHQRETFRWKGLVRCDLGPANVDAAASAELTRRGA